MNYKDYIANENQLYGVREFRLDNDLHQKLLYVYNASGLTLIVNQSRNCDISEVKVRGNNISYLSSVDYDFPNKETHPSNFLSSFLGSSFCLLPPESEDVEDDIALLKGLLTELNI